VLAPRAIVEARGGTPADLRSDQQLAEKTQNLIREQDADVLTHICALTDTAMARCRGEGTLLPPLMGKPPWGTAEEELRRRPAASYLLVRGSLPKKVQARLASFD